MHGKVTPFKAWLTRKEASQVEQGVTPLQLQHSVVSPTMVGWASKAEQISREIKCPKQVKIRIPMCKLTTPFQFTMFTLHNKANEQV
jgi:hypothetical protein